MSNSRIFSSWRNDAPSSIVVFLVAMPLCLGIALASGAPLFSGIIAGIVGGIVVGVLSGSPLGVSGPAAGLAVIVLTAIDELGTFEIFLMAVVLAGIIQLVFGYIKAGVIGYYFPSSVIKGMLSGIGIIIILKQIPHAFGYDADPEGDLAFSQVDGHNTFSELVYMLDNISIGATVITAVSLFILILWERPFFKSKPIFKVIQGPLVAVLAGIGLNLTFKDSATLNISADHLVTIPVSDSLNAFFGQFSFPDWSQWNNPAVYTIAFTMAVVASLETLLCVEATDKLDPLKRVTPTNRELKAQGVGNIVSGLIGGLPVTQVIVRSSANIQSGGQTKLSAILHGFLLLITAMAIPHLINLVPLASLAAILLVVGYKLSKPSLYKQMWAQGRPQFLPFIVTIIGIIFTDLLMGIALGVIVAIFHILWKNLKLPYHYYSDEHKEGQPIVIQLAEEVSFLNKASILQTLNHLPNESKVEIDATKTRYMHPDVIEIIEDFTESAKSRAIEVKFIRPQLEEYNPAKDFADKMADHKRRRKKD